MKPFFSIITVTKNTEKKINLTIASVLSQSFKNFEYIIVDGHSVDDTFVKINRYNKNKKIKIYRRRDKNFYDGLNFAISKTKGDYISILNSGDIYFSKSILKNINKDILKNKNFKFYFSNLIYFNKKKKVNRIWDNVILSHSLLDAFKIPHPTIFLRREIARKFKYNDNFKIAADLDFIFRLIKNNINYKYLNFFTVAMETGGMSTGYDNIVIKLKEDLKIIKKYFKNYISVFLIQKLNKIKSLTITQDLVYSKYIKKYINYLILTNKKIL